MRTYITYLPSRNPGGGFQKPLTAAALSPTMQVGGPTPDRSLALLLDSADYPVGVYVCIYLQFRHKVHTTYMSSSPNE